MTSTGTPLVSILIPAYNEPDLLEIALQSALAQTYSNMEIVICDDSTDDRVEEMLVPYLEKHANIRYFRNEKQLREDNFNRCIEHANGEYINFLCHDDRFHPDKIRRMAGWLNLPDVALVTSYRQRIDGFGNPLPDIAATSRLSWVDTVIPNTVLADHCLKHVVNPIGEPTTVLFRKRDLKEPFGYYHGKKYVPINDLATWMQLLSKGACRVYCRSAQLIPAARRPGPVQREHDHSRCGAMVPANPRFPVGRIPPVGRRFPHRAYPSSAPMRLDRADGRGRRTS